MTDDASAERIGKVRYYKTPRFELTKTWNISPQVGSVSPQNRAGNSSPPPSRTIHIRTGIHPRKIAETSPIRRTFSQIRKGGSMFYGRNRLGNCWVKRLMRLKGNIRCLLLFRIQPFLLQKSTVYAKIMMFWGLRSMYSRSVTIADSDNGVSERKNIHGSQSTGIISGKTSTNVFLNQFRNWL